MCVICLEAACGRSILYQAEAATHCRATDSTWRTMLMQWSDVSWPRSEVRQCRVRSGDAGVRSHIHTCDSLFDEANELIHEGHGGAAIGCAIVSDTHPCALCCCGQVQLQGCCDKQYGAVLKA